MAEPGAAAHRGRGPRRRAARAGAAAAPGRPVQPHLRVRVGLARAQRGVAARAGQPARGDELLLGRREGGR